MARGPQRPFPSRSIRPVVAVIIAAAVVLPAVTGFIWASKSVTVVVDGEVARYKTQAGTVGSLLSDAGVSLGDGDLVTPSASSALRSGDAIVVRHAKRVNLMLGSDAMAIDVVGVTVADALVAAGLDPAGDVAVTPAIETRLFDGMTVTAADSFVRVVSSRARVPFTRRTVPDPALPSGASVVVRKGQTGKRLRIFETVVTEGREGRRVLKADRVLFAPVDEVVAVGAGSPAPMVAASIKAAAKAAPRAASGRVLNVEATAYSPGDGCDHITATGARARRGIIAVDPGTIPLGTRLYVPGYGYGVAADTGGAIDGLRIDLCFDTRAEAISWGRRSVRVVILR